MNGGVQMSAKPLTVELGPESLSALRKLEDAIRQNTAARQPAYPPTPLPQPNHPFPWGQVWSQTQIAEGDERPYQTYNPLAQGGVVHGSSDTVPADLDNSYVIPNSANQSFANKVILSKGEGVEKFVAEFGEQWRDALNRLNEIEETDE